MDKSGGPLQEEDESRRETNWNLCWHDKEVKVDSLPVPPQTYKQGEIIKGEHA